MIIEKTIQTKVHLVDPLLLYSADINAVVMDNLKQRFEGYCYASCLILEIVEIQERSRFKFSKERQDASASCCVRFKVRGLIIKNHEMLHNCVVKKVHKEGHIICKNKHAAVYIKASKTLQTIKEGQTIVALAGPVKYKLFKPAISVNALPFIPMFRDMVVYNVTVKTKESIITNVLNRMAQEQKANEGLDKDVKMFFTDLLYPYQSKKTLTEKLQNGTITTLEKIASMKEGTQLFISQPDFLPQDTPSVIVYKQLKTDDVLGLKDIQSINGGMVVLEKYETILGWMIHTHIEYLISIRNLCTTYNTMDDVKKNNNLWDIYKRYRRA